VVFFEGEARMKTYNVGIIGYGGFGEFLKNSWEKLDNVKVTAVADQVADRNPGGGIKFYNRWQDLLEDGQVDIVSVATPPKSHADIGCAAMEAGKCVLIEKPMATTLDDARRIIETRDRTGVAASVDYMLRFNPICEMLAIFGRENVLGQLRHVNVENYAQDEGLPASHWFWDSDMSGGILIEHAVHFIDLVHSLTEQRHVHVTGFCHKRNDKQEDQVLACAHYDGGLIATHYHWFARPGFFEDTSIRFNYDLGQIDLEGWIPLAGTVSAMVNSQTKERLMELPGLKGNHICSVDEVKDMSRPEGWGNVNTTGSKQKVRCGGIEYDVEAVVEDRFEIGKSKQQVYSDCLRGILNDLICKIENPDYRMRVRLEEGLSSLEVAWLATEFGRSN
jgi:predicted dehydrogenase